ncbi:MAG TPA: undecaprenyldiphospho-muramoylpentapeptide beta-N-acetylglucosaminyltransferase [Bacillota bacterium]|nr:undecaprenyldiphospho-muramoylpentapeptide beta-N-acetylglucosaminyltransferase [Bacillota bacterium]
MKNIIITGGGTAGHVTPNIALFPYLKDVGYTIYYIGTQNGIEKELIPKEKIEFFAINAGKLRRYLDFKNVTDVFKIFSGFMQSLSLIKKLKPEVIFSKGGFVACPVVWAGWICKVPTIIHESDITPGLTNRLCIPFANKICYTFPETQKYLPAEKAVLTGIPIRKSLSTGSKQKGFEICGFSPEKPVIVIIGGSQGAENINKFIRKILKSLLEGFQVCHICGKGNIDQNYTGIKGYRQFEYISDEQPHIYAIADLFISRAGATAIFEILALRKPNLLIPLSKKASRGDQILNAKSFEKQGFSKVIMEEDLTEQSLLDNIREVYAQRSKYIACMEKNAVGAAENKIIDLIKEISQ